MTDAGGGGGDLGYYDYAPVGFNTGVPDAGGGGGGLGYYDYAPVGYNTGPSAADVINPAIIASNAASSPSFLDKAKDYISSFPEKTLLYLSEPKNLVPTALGAVSAYGGIKSIQEADRQREEAERILADQENQKAEDIERAKEILKRYPLRYSRLTKEDFQKYKFDMGGSVDDPGSNVAHVERELYSRDMDEGGIASLKKGGLPPRYLSGSGDGMSDSIKARIGGVQEARLADGEFVIPADVVSHLGNGSSNAGAKKLYAMMDRIRKARTGKKRQAPEVKTERYMPV